MYTCRQEQQHCCRTAGEKERKINHPNRNKCDWNCPDAHICKLRTCPLVISLEKTSWWDDLLWICEAKASMENKIWLLLSRLRLIPLSHWHDLNGSGAESLPGSMHRAAAACFLPSLPSSETTCPSTQPQAITPARMTHLGSPWCQWPGTGTQLFWAGSYCGLFCHKRSDWTGGWHCPELE